MARENKASPMAKNTNQGDAIGEYLTIWVLTIRGELDTGRKNLGERRGKGRVFSGMWKKKKTSKTKESSNKGLEVF